MAIIIDETVILRYVLADNKRQAKQAAEAIAGGQAYTYPDILARAAVTLRDVYRVPRSIIGETLSRVLDEVHVMEPDVIRLACRYFGTTQLDFTDCMIMARNVLRGYDVLSFDKGLSRRMLPPDVHI